MQKKTTKMMECKKEYKMVEESTVKSEISERTVSGKSALVSFDFVSLSFLFHFLLTPSTPSLSSKYPIFILFIFFLN